MAKKKSASKKGKSDNGKTAPGFKYPDNMWDKMLNGQRHVYKSGTDYICTTKAFIHYCRKRGIVAGWKLEVEVLDDGAAVAIKKGGKYDGVQSNPLQHKEEGQTQKKSKKKGPTKKAAKPKARKSRAKATATA